MISAFGVEHPDTISKVKMPGAGGWGRRATAAQEKLHGVQGITPAQRNWRKRKGVRPGTKPIGQPPLPDPAGGLRREAQQAFEADPFGPVNRPTFRRS